MSIRLTRLRADATAEQRALFAAAFREALDRLDVEPGGEFYLTVVPPAAHARRTDPQTSKAAAESVDDIGGKQRAVLSVLEMHFPISDDELVRRYVSLAKAGRFPEQSESGIRSRRNELALAGHVVDTGEKARLESGRYAILWGVPRAPEPRVPEQSAASFFGLDAPVSAATPRNALFDVD